MTHTTGAQFCTTHCNASRSSRLVTKLASAGLLQASQYTAIYCIHLRAYSYIHIQYYNNKLRCSRVGTVVYVPTSQPIVDALLHEPNSLWFPRKELQCPSPTLQETFNQSVLRITAVELVHRGAALTAPPWLRTSSISLAVDLDQEARTEPLLN